MLQPRQMSSGGFTVSMKALLFAIILASWNSHSLTTYSPFIFHHQTKTPSNTDIPIS